MVWKTLTDGFAVALEAAGLPGGARLGRLELAIPREPAHGDWTTNLALLLGREARLSQQAVRAPGAAHFRRIEAHVLLAAPDPQAAIVRQRGDGMERGQELRCRVEIDAVRRRSAEQIGHRRVSADGMRVVEPTV